MKRIAIQVLAVLLLTCTSFAQEKDKVYRSHAHRLYGDNLSANLSVLANGVSKLGRTPLHLFESDKVVEDLKLSPKQIEEARALKQGYPVLSDMFKLAGVGDGKEIGRMDLADAKKLEAALNGNIESLHKGTKESVKKILTPKQNKRLQEIYRQEILLGNERYLIPANFDVSEEEFAELIEDFKEDDKEIERLILQLKWRIYVNSMSKRIGGKKVKRLLGKPFYTDLPEVQSDEQNSRR